MCAPASVSMCVCMCVCVYTSHPGVALPLVNAFAIPDHILRAPIGILGGAGVTDIYKEYLLSAGFDV